MENPRNPNRPSPEEFETDLIRRLAGIPITPDLPKDDPFLRQVNGLLQNFSNQIIEVVPLHGHERDIYKSDFESYKRGMIAAAYGLDPDAIYKNNWIQPTEDIVIKK